MREGPYAVVERTMSASSTLRDLVSELGEDASITGGQAPSHPLPAFASVMVDALDTALLLLGRSGTDVFHRIMLNNYGLRREDVALRPGQYMSALKVMLDAAGAAVERYILKEVNRVMMMAAQSIEEAVGLLKGI